MFRNFEMHLSGQQNIGWIKGSRVIGSVPDFKIKELNIQSFKLAYPYVILLMIP